VNHRWLGGTLTNMTTIRKSVARWNYLEALPTRPEFKAMSKKEIASLNREKVKLERNLAGVRGMDGLPDAVVIVDSAREHIAVHEAAAWAFRLWLWWTATPIQKWWTTPLPRTTTPSAPSASSCRS